MVDKENLLKELKNQLPSIDENIRDVRANADKKIQSLTLRKEKLKVAIKDLEDIFKELK